MTADYAAQYGQLLDHAGLYERVPDQWLHATVLCVGFIDDFSEAEMLEVATRLEPKLAAMQMPEFLLGQWWIWGGNPCVHFTPESPFNELFNLVFDELLAVVGEGRVAQSQTFTPHISLAYSKTYDDEVGLFKQLESRHIAAVPVRVKRLSLVKQRVTDNCYTWTIVREMPLGQYYA